MNFLKALILPVFLCLQFVSMAGDCFPWPMTMKEMLKKHSEPFYKDKHFVYFRGTVIGKNTHAYPSPFYKALDVKITQYWSDKSLDLPSDTLCIMANSECAFQLKNGEEYLLALLFDEGYFTDRQWSGTDLYSHYEKDIALLGTPKPAVRASSEAKEELISNTVKNEKPKRSKEEKKNQLLIWLGVSLALNFFAILLIVILKRDKH